MPSKKPNCFTIRLPIDLYTELAELASASDVTMNAKVIELLKVGITRTVDVRQLLENLMDKEFGPRGVPTST